MFGTGAGITVLIAAGLGMLVGVVVVAQTIYAATVDHIREYGTLKAMGATNGYIYRVILQQAVAERGRRLRRRHRRSRSSSSRGSQKGDDRDHPRCRLAGARHASR